MMCWGEVLFAVTAPPCDGDASSLLLLLPPPLLLPLSLGVLSSDAEDAVQIGNWCAASVGKFCGIFVLC